MFKIPVLIIIFNRPDFARKLFQVLEQIKPLKLYVISDGPRTVEDEKNVMQSREIFNEISWNCEVKYNYSEVNLGLRKRISGGISWAFENEDKLIILEDDCIAHLDFFDFCEDLLIKYQDDKRIMAINGCNLNSFLCQKSPERYFFSKYANSWGWATWKRAWELFDSELLGLEDINSSSNFVFNLPYRYRSTIYWKFKLNQVKNSKINSWAYRWMFTLWLNNGLAIVPHSNLIQNMGNDKRSTNTRGDFHYLNISTSNLNINKTLEPEYIIANTSYDEWLEDTIYSKSINHRFRWVLKKIFKINGFFEILILIKIC